MRATLSENFDVDRLSTLIGTALLVTDADGHLRALDWEDYETRMRELLRLHYGAVNLKPARAPRDMWKAISIASKRSDGASRARHSSRRSGAHCRRFRQAQR